MLISVADAENGNLGVDSEESDRLRSIFAFDEGGEEGILKAGMLSYAFMEIVLCVMVRQVRVVVKYLSIQVSSN